MKKTLRPEITLIISSSVDGCLIGRDSDELDSNKNWKDSNIIRGIIQQFFDFSPNSSEVFNLVTASTALRIGVENSAFVPKKENIKLIVLDKGNELSSKGVENLALSVKELIVVNTGKNKKSKKPVKTSLKNCKFLQYKKEIDIADLAKTLKKKYGVNKLTIQSAGLLNSDWIDAGVVSFLTIILYPLLVSKNGTPTLIDSDTFTVRPLSLISAKVFDKNYILLRYKVIN